MAIDIEDDFFAPLEYKYIVSMDPGVTTGIACIRYTDETLPELIYLHQIEDGRVGFWDWFQGSDPTSDVTIVSEMWDEHNVKGANREPQYIEGVQYAIWQDEIVYQTPDMKSLIGDDFLRDENLWVENYRHAMDALIHGLVYLRNHDHTPTLKALSSPVESQPETIADPGDAQRMILTEEQVEEHLRQVRGEPEDGEGGDGEGEGEGDKQDGQGDADGDSDGSGEAQGKDGGDAKPTGSGGAGEAGEWKDPEIKGKRKRRERNGVFAGYEADTEGIETELYSD